MTGFGRTIEDILSRRNFAVVGASRNPDKFGYQVCQSLKRAGYNVFPVNPNAETVDDDQVYPHLDNVPEAIDCVVCVVPPEITFETIKDAGKLKVPYVWIQPGAESQAAVIEALSLGITPVYGGPCIMVEIDRRKAVVT
jgi:predicted CoA-binding protein